MTDFRIHSPCSRATSKNLCFEALYQWVRSKSISLLVMEVEFEGKIRSRNLMNKQHLEIITGKLAISAKQIENTVKLLEEGATVPFVSRYRKEATGSLDELKITAIKEQLAKLKEVDKRRESMINSIEEQGKLTDELRAQLENTYALTELEDIYLPYKIKRKTRALLAREKGLEPLAKIIMKQQESNIYERAKSFINEKAPTIEDVLQGATDIISEWINENQRARNKIRKLFSKKAMIKSKVVKAKEKEGIKYKDYFNYEERLKRSPSHRLLAVRRGEKEGFLRVSIAPPQDCALRSLEKIFIKGNNESSEQVRLAIKDSYQRLLRPSLETEFANSSKEKADKEAINVFAENLRQLLLAPPLGQKRVLAIDPGYRTGCKVVCLDEQGNMLSNETIFPHKPQEEINQAAKKIKLLVNRYKIEAIAIGNRTASRETERFIKEIQFEKDVQMFTVNEDGASVYSASPTAREEFPQYDVTVRGAISIGRRLMDPLAELVKIEPRSMGIGQYQHDVDQNRLKESLDRVVESSVNLVGVNLNTASKHLLTYVSGLGPRLAKNIIDYRKENCPFQSREELKKVPRLGNKAFEQCAGFLRIQNARNPLDNSAVHPESYYIVEQMAEDLGNSISELLNNEELRNKIEIKNHVADRVGLPTLIDIVTELAKPGRDPRKKIKIFEFAKRIQKIEDLDIGMILPGIITNITNFGVFVDIGVKQDGLVHVSQLADRFVIKPADVVQLQQHVKVKVMNIDIERKRISLSMKDLR